MLNHLESSLVSQAITQLKKLEFKESFSNWWYKCQVGSWEGHTFMMKLKFVKAKLKDWNKALFGDKKEKKNNIMLDIVKIDLVE